MDSEWCAAGIARLGAKPPRWVRASDDNSSPTAPGRFSKTCAAPSKNSTEHVTDAAMKKPIVYLIGAGPGDPGLITIRGLRCLGQADVVIYDHLVHQRLVRHARPEAERIDVGPAAPEPLEQEAICYLLAEKALEGKVVARLKWGDPCLLYTSDAADDLLCVDLGGR